MLIAHIRQGDFERQYVQDHLDEVAVLARKYGTFVGFGAHAELAGFLHDMGKFTKEFTRYIENAVLHNQIDMKKIDHSTAGAKYLYERYYGKNQLQNFVVETIGMAILSHHAGMQDFIQLDLTPSDYFRRVSNEELPYYDEVVKNFERIEGNAQRVAELIQEANQEMNAFFKKIKRKKHPITYFSYMQKLVFSCLIDADRTNTRCFEEKESLPFDDYSSVFEQGYIYLMEQIDRWKGNEKKINQLRTRMSENCDTIAEKQSSIYTLSIPTGGGKTYASLRYALKHAKLYNKSRIFYVVPYTTILEQNAQAVRKIIQQSDVVLEHHANIIDDTSLDAEQDYYRIKHHKQLQLGRDNWDYPIIFTTMVQFLDTFFQKGTRKSRRLHNLANSVIVFDEVQSVPYKHFALFNTAVNFLNTIGNSSILLCTATQPAVAEMDYPIELTECSEIVPELEHVVKAFERVQIHNHVIPQGYDSEEIAKFVNELMITRQSVLIILNTKKAVKKVYEALERYNHSNIYHLSTAMCPAHRTKKLDDVKEKLGKVPVVCISTQLIEAGVDISFEVVIRSLAGLDSIAQAAGRCNRNSEREKGDVYVIRAVDEKLTKIPEIRIGAEVTSNYILREELYKNAMLCPEAINTYFQHFDQQAKREINRVPKGLTYELIHFIDGFFDQKIKKQNQSNSMFKTLEQHFEAIDNKTTAVLVPYGKGKEIIASLNEELHDLKEFNTLLKHAQQYSVNLYENELRELNNAGLLAPLYNNTLYYIQESAYSDSFGVSFDGNQTQSFYSY